MITKYILVFVITLVAGGFSIPIGILINLDPFGVFLVALAGSLSFMTIVLWKGTEIVERVMPNATEKATESRAAEFLDRWGVPGLGVVGGLLLGPAITLAAAIALGVDRRRFAVWFGGATLIGFAMLTLFWDWLLS